MNSPVLPLTQSIFTPQALVDLGAILTTLGVKAVHEHSAWHATGNMDDHTAAFLRVGFEIRFHTSVVAFLERDDKRVELIRPEIPQHEAYAVQTRHEWDSLREKLSVSPAFTIVEEHVYSRDDLLAVMYTHSDGGCFQFIWRKVQLFKGLFDN